MKFIYNQKYGNKLFILTIISVSLCLISRITNYTFIPMPSNDIFDYHLNILTVNSILSGFALTNLGILLSISDDQLIEKLKGTDILQKRNIVIGHSIIFGSVSILISIFWVLNMNFNFLKCIIPTAIIISAKEIFFYIEIFSLIISILYFLLSVRKMIQLLALIHVPQRRYTDEQIERMKRKISK